MWQAHVCHRCEESGNERFRDDEASGTAAEVPARLVSGNEAGRSGWRVLKWERRRGTDRYDGPLRHSARKLTLYSYTPIGGVRSRPRLKDRLDPARVGEDEWEMVVRLAFLAAAGVVFAWIGGGTIPLAQAQNLASCPSGRVCLYENIGFGGAVWTYASSQRPLPADVDNRASSVSNATSAVLRLYEGSSFNGANICLNPGASIDNLVNLGLNDAVSSIQIGPETSC